MLIATGAGGFGAAGEEMPSRIARVRRAAGWSAIAPTTAITSPTTCIGAARSSHAAQGAHRQRFSNHKPATLMRRIHRRMTVVGIAELAHYARRIREQPDEAVTLMRELLIQRHAFPVPRRPRAFRVLERTGHPAAGRVEGASTTRSGSGSRPARRARRPTTPSPCCSRSRLTPTPTIRRHRCSRPTLDEDAVAAARDGYYTERPRSRTRVRRTRRAIFPPRDDRLPRSPRAERADSVRAPQPDQDPPFAHLDLISCRNLLIYLNRAAQDRIIEVFHFALRPGGFCCSVHPSRPTARAICSPPPIAAFISIRAGPW